LQLEIDMNAYKMTMAGASLMAMAAMAQADGGNVAIGPYAMTATTGIGNTGIGEQALMGNGQGGYNASVGYMAMLWSTTGSYNAAIGYMALASNNTLDPRGNMRSGDLNVGIGAYSLYGNVGGSNVAIGPWSMYLNNKGIGNVSVGRQSLYGNLSGNYNTALGLRSLENVTGSNNVAIGVTAGSLVSSGSGNIHIGNVGKPSDNAAIRIGSAQTSAYLAGAVGRTVDAKTAAVLYIDASGKIGTVPR
jgi:hypothetical protein